MKKATFAIAAITVVGSGYFFQRAWRGLDAAPGASASAFFQEQVNAFTKGAAQPRKDFKVGAPVSPAAGLAGSASGGLALPLPKTPGGTTAGEEPVTSIDEKIRAELRRPLSPAEVESVADFMNILVSHNGDGTTPAELVKQLERAGLDPKTALDENADTGKMVVVRTGESLPGTRYFHAQFFEDENGLMQAQHISFEVRPGPDSEQVAQDLIRKNFVGIGKPTTENGDFREWKTKNCKTVWMKKLKEEDMLDNPYNAYIPEQDKGTILVSQQEDPHCHAAATEHQ